MLSWFSNDLSGKTQCVELDDCTSSVLEVKMGVPRGSVLGPILFSISINNLGRDLKQTKVLLYADDTILYTSATSVKEAITYLQSFSQVKIFLVRLKLLLNVFYTFTLSNKLHYINTGRVQ